LAGAAACLILGAGGAVACSFVMNFDKLSAGRPKTCSSTSYVPAAGTYLYDSLDGGDTVIVGGTPLAAFAFDNPIAATATPDPSTGCWTYNMVLSTNQTTGQVVHEHDYQFCSDAGLLVVQEVDKFSPVPGANIVATYYCGGELYVDPCLAPGANLPLQGNCSGVAQVVLPPAICGGPTFSLHVYLSDAEYDFRGVETMRIGGVDAQVLHYTQHRQTTLESQEAGVTASDWWFVADGGLPAQHLGVTVVNQGVMTGDSGCTLATTYVSTSAWRLRSLSPFPVAPDQ